MQITSGSGKVLVTEVGMKQEAVEKLVKIQVVVSGFKACAVSLV